MKVRKEIAYMNISKMCYHQVRQKNKKLRSLGDILKAMKKEDLIRTDGRNWFEK